MNFEEVIKIWDEIAEYSDEELPGILCNIPGWTSDINLAVKQLQDGGLKLLNRPFRGTEWVCYSDIDTVCYVCYGYTKFEVVSRMWLLCYRVKNAVHP
jgi:hypothetical protein